MPGCTHTKRLQAHHIKPWAMYPSLRYNVANGITLCRYCHDIVKDSEADYEVLFTQLIETKDKKDLFLQARFEARKLYDLYGDS